MKKKPLPILRDDLLNWWLEKFHNTSLQQVVETVPKDVREDDWWKLYPVSQEQYNEWEAWAKSFILKTYKIDKKYLERKWGYIALDCAPYIKPI